MPITSDIALAAARLRQGGLVAFPTETVYGLGADAANPEAVRRIFAVKGRPATHPLIVHIGETGMMSAWARDIPPAAVRLRRREACRISPETGHPSLRRLGCRISRRRI